MDWSYIAGFFDGEGCVHLHKRKCRGWRRCLTIGQKDPEPLEVIQEFLYKQGINLRFYKYSNNGNAFYTLYVSKIRDIEKVIRNILPYLVIKREACEKMLDNIAQFAENKV